MEASLTRVKERLEKETAAHLEMKARVSELEDRNIQLEHQANCERGERHRLEQLVSSGSLPDDAKVTALLISHINLSFFGGRANYIIFIFIGCFRFSV